MMRRKLFSIITSVVLATGMLLPYTAFAEEYTDNGSTDASTAYEENTSDPYAETQGDTYDPYSSTEANTYDPYSSTESDTSDQYEYYDENGQLIEEEDDGLVPVEKDTSWFDYNNPRKSYNISTEEQLFGLASLVNEEQFDNWKPTRTENFKGVTFNLVKDIELTYYWTPIGTGDAVNFAGIFDGNGHTISGLDIDETSEYTGFFGYLTGQVCNLSIEGDIQSSGNNCGALAGQLAPGGKIVNCVTDVTISGKGQVGGVVGYNNCGTLQNSINCADIIGSYTVGGVVGENWGGVLSECGNRGKVISIDEGVAVNGTGGVAGRSVSADSVLSSCYNTGDIESHNYCTGGVVGYTNAEGAKISSCYNIGKITIYKEEAASKDSDSKDKKSKKVDKKIEEEEALTSPYYLGGVAGLVGIKGVVIENCYNAGRLMGADASGGIIGKYMNESLDEDDPFIINNTFVESYADYGVGSDFEDNAVDIMNGTSGNTMNAIMKMGAALGTEYMEDYANAYGSEGFPVLRWQQPLQTGERAHVPELSVELQETLDDALVTYEEKAAHGDAFKALFDGKTYIGNNAGQAADFANGESFEIKEDDAAAPEIIEHAPESTEGTTEE